MQEKSCLTGCSRIQHERGLLAALGRQRLSAGGDEGGWVSSPPEHYSFWATVFHNLLCNMGSNRQSAEHDTNGELLRKNKNLVTN